MAETDATRDQPGVTGPSDQEMVRSLDSAADLASILDRYMADLGAGRAPDRRQLCAGHPELAGQLEACLAGIEFIHQATGSATEAPATLGEFRIIRELGRGGMGVVYEAEQTSLRRHVALKVLRFGAVADEDAMNRFRREAETVARLHHTNIVPIFAAGCERGVHYYAMQYIAGRSLADVLAESQQTGQPVPADDVARWGLQAAEALAHAHQRGVIHRDIKPSNLLLDGDGIVWLTDFGLAKRMDEATLTVHGTLMGTPRYMSPEQAASLQQPVDRRTDVYSLGATLYELATGRALFESAQPHLVIAQILTEEPARPRQIRPALPRDLETVILTCLAKEPLKRYQSAPALASDLRAVLEGRPIQARRAPALARIVRYVRQRRKTLTGASIAAAATVLLMVGALVGWRYYADWRIGRVALTTDGPPLAAEILPESSSDRPIGEPFDIGARTVVALPAGDYRLRVKARGLMSQTYRVAINRGETITHHLTLHENRLLGGESIPFSPVTETVTLSPGKTDFIEWNGATLIRRDGSTGKPVWDAARPARPWSPERDPVAALRRLSRFGDEKRPGELVEPAADLDGDGTGDLVWAIRGTSSLLALSGKDGSPLWTYSADPGDPPTLRSAPAVPHPGRVVGTPAAVEVDGDGTIDLLAEFAVFDDPKGLLNVPGATSASGAAAEKILSGRRIVVAVSGRTGKEFWSHVIDRKPTDLPRESFDHGITYVSPPKRPFVAFVDGSKWIGLDPLTGRAQRAAIELGFTPVLPVQHVDLDGDGVMEILALEAGQGRQPLATPKLVAFSTATGERLWVEKLMAYFRPQEGGPASKWPLAADLDGDGCPEVVVPDRGSLPPRNVDLYGGVRVLDGRTGQTRWATPLWPGMKNGSDSLAHLLAAPDLDADGTRDLIVVSRFSGREPNNQIFREPEPARVYVDALSGKDGRVLWSWRSEGLKEESTPIWSPFLWGRGSDGWPMLALPVGGRLGPGLAPVDRYRLPDPPAVHLLATATGERAHVINGLSWPESADVDGDGLVDLWGSVDDKLRVYRALAPESWRALGEFKPAGDLDGDGITDVLSNDLSPLASESGWSAKTQRRTALARSGRDGKVLWRTLLDPWKAWLAWGESGAAYTFNSLPSHGGDLDGDGFPDVLVRGGLGGSGMVGRKSSELQLQALSGRTGRFLWSAGPLPPLEFRPFVSNIEGTDVGTLGPGALPDVLVLHDTFYYTGPTPAARLYDQSRLARLSGRDGRVVWDVLLVEHTGGMSHAMGWAHVLTDLDGDGGREIVLQLNNKAASGPIPFELRVISLATGETRWSHALNPGPAAPPAFVVGDLDGDGRSEIIVAEQTRADGQSATEVTALGSLTGAPLWARRGGEAHDVPDQHLALQLAGFDGSGRRDVCVSFSIAPNRRRVEIIDAKGRSRVGRDAESISPPALTTVDLDGDGRDELLFHDGGRLCACRGDLSERWSLRSREAIREVFPAAPGRPATVVISPSLGIDGATGRPLWSIGEARSILRENDARNLPRSLAGPDGATVCRVAIPASAQGRDEPARGTPAKPSSPHDDPRWQRPLPWVGMVEPYADPMVQLAMGATLVNVCIPLAILWLATRRRFWSVQLLLALPAVVAVLLVGFSAVSSLIPDRRQSTEQPLWLVVVGITMFSMVGLPIVVYTTAFGSALVRLRWRKMGLLVATASLAAILIAAIMLRSDMRAKPLIEHYDWSSWHQVGYRGAYAVGALMLLARPARAIGRFVSRLVRRRRSAAISPSS